LPDRAGPPTRLPQARAVGVPEQHRRHGAVHQARLPNRGDLQGAGPARWPLVRYDRDGEALVGGTYEALDDSRLRLAHRTHRRGRLRRDLPLALHQEPAAAREGDVPVDAAGRHGPRLPERRRREPASPTYGKILRKVEVGSSGNEAHHMGFTDDRTKIWAASLNTSRFFIFDVGGDPMNPRLVRTVDDVPRVTGLSGP